MGVYRVAITPCQSQVKGSTGSTQLHAEFIGWTGEGGSLQVFLLFLWAQTDEAETAGLMIRNQLSYCTVVFQDPIFVSADWMSSLDRSIFWRLNFRLCVGDCVGS